MTRLKQAWLALCGKLEPEVREVVREVEVPVIGSAQKATLYVNSREPYAFYLGADDRTYYLTCQQAHEANPGGVHKVDALLIGGDYYISGRLQKVDVSKPKRAKGKA